MIRMYFNNKYFRIEKNYSFNFSNSEVTFSNLTIDFTGKEFADIPYKYQEIKIVETDSEQTEYKNVLFTGYVNTIKLSNLKNKVEERSLTISLLSPLKMATVRTATLIGLNKISTAILKTLQPLINDGFILKEFNIPDGEITTSFVMETIENCMNIICRKKNLFWYINEKKEIFINSLQYLFDLKPKKIINENIKEEGLIQLQPSIVNIDYANVINFKNINLIYSQFNDNVVTDYTNGYPIINMPKNIKYGDIITFNYPIIIAEEYLKKYIKEMNEQIDSGYIANILMTIMYNSQEGKTYRIGYDTNSEYVKTEGITFNDDDGTEGEIVLQRDSMFKNLITGFKWNVNRNATIIEFVSRTALKNTKLKFMSSKDINLLKNIISNTGIIEKTIDYQEKWATINEVTTFARSILKNNSNIVNEVLLEFDKNPNLKIGDIIKIEAESYYIYGNFAVESIKYNYTNENDENWLITAKTSDFLTTYIDLFRRQEQEQNQDTSDELIISEYIEEKIEEIHIVEGV